MSLLSEFKDFALKGNVMDMAVGVIIGAAFGNIVTALTDNFINPLIAVIFGGNSEDGLQIGGQFVIRGVAFNYGAFLSAVVNFLIIALVLFIIVKSINKLNSSLEKEKEAAPAPSPVKSDETKALEEIITLLKEQQNKQ